MLETRNPAWFNIIFILSPLWGPSLLPSPLVQMTSPKIDIWGRIAILSSTVDFDLSTHPRLSLKGWKHRSHVETDLGHLPSQPHGGRKKKKKKVHQERGRYPLSPVAPVSTLAPGLSMLACVLCRGRAQRQERHFSLESSSCG